MNASLWYCARRGAREPSGPFPLKTIQQMIAQGTLAREDLVWREGFLEWTRVADAAELRSPPAGEEGLSALSHWMTMTGVLCIVAGIGRCLTLVGLPVGVLMILGGGALLGARSFLGGWPPADPTRGPFLIQMTQFLRRLGWALMLGMAGTVFWACFYFGVFTGLLSWWRGS